MYLIPAVQEVRLTPRSHEAADRKQATMATTVLPKEQIHLSASLKPGKVQNAGLQGRVVTPGSLYLLQYYFSLCQKQG